MRATDLPAAQAFVAGQVKDIDDELRYGIAPDKQEDRLTILDEVEPVALEALGRERQRRRHDHAVVVDRPALQSRCRLVSIP
jgi:hypothetical protein